MSRWEGPNLKYDRISDIRGIVITFSPLFIIRKEEKRDKDSGNRYLVKQTEALYSPPRKIVHPPQNYWQQRPRNFWVSFTGYWKCAESVIRVIFDLRDHLSQVFPCSCSYCNDAHHIKHTDSISFGHQNIDSTFFYHGFYATWKHFEIKIFRISIAYNKE